MNEKSTPSSRRACHKVSCVQRSSDHRQTGRKLRLYSAHDTRLHARSVSVWPRAPRPRTMRQPLGMNALLATHVRRILYPWTCLIIPCLILPASSHRIHAASLDHYLLIWDLVLPCRRRMPVFKSFQPSSPVSSISQPPSFAKGSAPALCPSVRLAAPLPMPHLARSLPTPHLAPPRPTLPHSTRPTLHHAWQSLWRQCSAAMLGSSGWATVLGQ